MEPVTRDRLQALYQRALASGDAAHGAHVAPEALLALVERQGDEAQRLAAMDHVMRCGTCREGFELLRALQAAQSGEPERLPQRRRRWTSLAMAASLLLAVGVATVQWRNGRTASTGETMRGTASLPVAVTPVGSVSADSARTYVWRAVPAAIRYDLELLAADGGLLHSAATADTSYTLPLTVALATGREYQWLVTAELPEGGRSVSPGGRFTVR